MHLVSTLRRTLLAVVVIFLTVTTTASAQDTAQGLAQNTRPDVPAYASPYLNDYAQMFSAETAQTVDDGLRKLRDEIAVEFTVLTVPDMARYGDWTEIEPFATAIFNSWGIGDATANNGILLLIAKDDRALRIELGAGYPPVYEDIAADIINFHITPHYKDGFFEEGTLIGVEKITTHIARSFAQGEASPSLPAREKSSGESGFQLVPTLAFSFFGLVLSSMIGVPIWKKVQFSRKPCPRCGTTGMKRETLTLLAATSTRNGKRETTISCQNCDYRDVTTSVSLWSSDSGSNSSGGGGSSFGGGSSSGGGASGRW
jgi:uncharacterized protein